MIFDYAKMKVMAKRYFFTNHNMNLIASHKQTKIGKVLEIMSLPFERE